jgi:hypothetical protein
MNKQIFLSGVLSILLVLGVGAVAVTKTDIQIDEEGQKVISLYGNHLVGSDWVTDYNDGVLTIPNEMVCVLNQLWKSEFLNKGNLHVEINEKKCFGNEDGQESIDAVVNLTTDPTTGQTTGKVWYDDTNSIDFPGRDVIVYGKVSVSASPTANEPYGRFSIDYVEEDKNTGALLAVYKVQGQGTNFKVTGMSPPQIQNITFAGYSTLSTKQAIYKLNSTETVLGYNDSFVCFKNAGSSEDCFSRSLSSPDAFVNAWSYGIYNSDGGRYLDAIGDLTIENTIYEIYGGVFGGVLRTKVGGNGPGNTARGIPLASDSVFWTNKDAVMTLNGQSKNMKVQWLIKTHSVPPSAAAPISSITDSTGINLTLSNSFLDDPALLDSSTAKSIGSFPTSDFSKPLVAKAGTVF